MNTCESCRRRHKCGEQLKQICITSDYSQFEIDRAIEADIRYIEGLRRRDTKQAPMRNVLHTSDETGKEYTYVLCPCCGNVLNKYDRFCRFCGQRVRNDDEGRPTHA